MTAQQPDYLINDYGELPLDSLGLYGVQSSDPAAPGGVAWYAFDVVPDPTKRKLTSTANWRGFSREYRLTEQGNLILERIFYPDRCASGPPDEIGEQLRGDFWLQMWRDFFGKSVYVPFQSGVLIADSEKWLFPRGAFLKW